jgi:hypothetical protein
VAGGGQRAGVTGGDMGAYMLMMASAIRGVNTRVHCIPFYGSMESGSLSLAAAAIVPIITLTTSVIIEAQLRLVKSPIASHLIRQCCSSFLLQ